MNWIIPVAVLATLIVIGFLLEREIYFYEGAHLGPRLQAWLYDRWSRKYDAGKRASQLSDDEMLAQPLLEALSAVPEPFILDFATGTGRLSYALMNRPEFNGHIIALDLSQGMLEQAAEKLQSLAGREKSARSTRLANSQESAAHVEFLRHLSLPLPFPDAAFDAVCALEVLELFPGMDEPLRELTRVLRPGGVLLTSRGTEESGRKAKVKNAREFIALLEKYDVQQIQMTRWWKLFDRVIAVKAGSMEPVTARSVASVLKCSACASIHWNRFSDMLKCQTCKRELAVTTQGIVLN